MSFPAAIREFNVFVDGTSYFGRATKARTPDIKLLTEEHRGAGMGGQIDIDLGLQKFAGEWEFAEYDRGILILPGTIISLTTRPVARREDSTIISHIETCRGLITGVEKDTYEGGKLIPLKLMMNPRYFRHELDSEVIHEVDLENGTRIIGGVDQTAEYRNAMGL